MTAHANTTAVSDRRTAPGAPPTRPPTVRHRIAAALWHRWPTALALLMTFDNWSDPSVPPPAVLLMLPAGYLLIGAVRRSLHPPRVLALQVAGMLGYVALTVAALSAGDRVAGALVAAGWLIHGVWDLAHHRADLVVPRAYAEWCAVIDGVIGLTIVMSLL